MSEEPHEPDDAAEDEEPGAEDLWEGVPLSLEAETEAEKGPALPPGEETVERPLAELLPPEGPSAAAQWLGRWLLLTGAVGVVLAVAAIVLALLMGARPVAWRGPVLAFDFAVIALIVRTFLVAGAPARIVCHRVFGVAGLAAAAVVASGALLHSVGRFIYGEPLSDLLTELSVFGLLGLAGCMVYVQCLRGRGWACRTAAVSAAVFLALLVLQSLTGYRPLGAGPAWTGMSLRDCWPGLAAVVACGVGFVVSREAVRRTQAHRKAWSAAAVACVAALVGGSAFLAWRVALEHGIAAASLGLATAAAALEAAAFAPLLLAGAVLAWRKRGRLPADLRDATGFTWSLVALAGTACLFVWLPLHWHADRLELLVLATGTVAAVAGAWFVQTRGDWVGRWALMPATGLAVLVFCSLHGLVALAQGVGSPQAVVVFLWCVLVVGLVLAASGLVARRHRARCERPDEVLRGDVRLLSAAGWVLSGACLCVLFALRAGEPRALAGLGSVLHGAGRLLEDLLVLGVGRHLVRAAAQAVSPVGSFFGGTAGAVAGVAALLAVLVLHVAAASRVRWAFRLVAAVWAPVLCAGVLFALLCISRLLPPFRVPALTTPVGRLLGSYFAGRALFLAVLVALLVRLAEAWGSVVRAAWPRRGFRAASRAPAPPPLAVPGGSHLSFLVGLGVVASAVGLALALLLHLGPEVEATLFELSGLARRCAHAAVEFGLHLGRLSAHWEGYAAATALIAFLLIAVHVEGRQGRAEVYSLLGALWGLVLLALTVAWVREVRATPRPAAPGVTLALGAAGLLLTVLFGAAVVLVGRWRRSEVRDVDAAGQRQRLGTTAAAHSLGSLGLALCLAGCAVVLHGALAGSAAYRQQFAQAAARAVGSIQTSAAQVDALKRTLEQSGDLGLGAAALTAASGAALLLHLLARYRIAWARMGLYVIWIVVAVVGTAALGYIANGQPFGAWSAWRVAGVLLLTAAVVRAFVALANSRSWLLRSAG